MIKERKIPKVRFKGFDDDWEQRKLGELGSVAMNKRIYKDQTTEAGDVPFYKIGTFGGEPDAYIPLNLFEEYKAKYPYPEVGDILISASGSIGRTVEYTGEDEYFQDSNIVWLKHDGSLNNSFLKQFYMVVEWEGLEGSTIKRLYNKSILETQILLPSLAEQERIGTFFQQLDNLITLHQRKLEAIKNLKKAMLQKMFPEKGEKYLRLRFAGFTDDWEQRKIKDIFKVTRGHVLAVTKTAREKTASTPYPVYSSQTTDQGLMGYYNDYLYSGAITWTTDGANAGTVNYREGKFYCTNVCGVLISEEGYANKMISEALNKVAWKHVSKVGNPKLMNNVMSEIVISIPRNMKEQSVISNFFGSLDNLITLHQRKLETLENLKKALLQRMFI